MRLIKAPYELARSDRSSLHYRRTNDGRDCSRPFVFQLDGLRVPINALAERLTALETGHRRRYTPTTLPSNMVDLKSDARTRIGAICELAGWKRT